MESKTDWQRLKDMTEKEIEDNAKSDPDAPLLTESQFKQAHKVADKLKSLNISRPDTLIHRPIFHGRSFFDKLKANEDISECLPILKKLADKEEQARHTLKGSSKHIRSFSDIANDYSCPLYMD